MPLTLSATVRGPLKAYGTGYWDYFLADECIVRIKMLSGLANATTTTDSDAIAREVSRSRRNRTLVWGTFLVLAATPAVSLDAALGAPVFTTTVLVIMATAYYAKILRYKGGIPKDEGSGFSLSGDIASVSSEKAIMPTVVGYKVGPNHWFVRRSFLTFDCFHARNIVWAYERRVRHMLYGIVPLYSEYHLLLKLDSGREITKRYSKGNVGVAMNFIQNTAPWAVFGYSKELDEVWRKRRDAFLAGVNERRRAFVLA